MKFRLTLMLALCGSLVIVACDDGGDSEPDTLADTATETDADTTAPDAGDVADMVPLPDGPTLRFDFAASTSGDFLAFPFPSELRQTAGGAPDVTGLPSGTTAVLTALIEDNDARANGASPLGGAYFEFEAGLDPTSLPASPNESVSTSATVYLVNLTEGSAAYGTKHPAQVRFVASASSGVPDNTLIITPAVGRPLLSGQRYAAVLTRGIQLLDGNPVGAQPIWEEIRSSVLPPDGVPADVHGQVRGLAVDLEDAGIAIDDVLAATAFSTADSSDSLGGFVEVVYDQLLQVPENVTLVEEAETYWLFSGEYPVIEVVDTTDMTTPGALITYDGDGKPTVQRTVNAGFAVITPIADDMNPPFFRTIIAMPPVGMDALTFVQAVGPLAAENGAALLAIDPVLTGLRAPAGTTDPSATLETVASSNPLGWRDLMLQALVDQAQFIRFSNSVSIDAAVTPIMDQVDFQPRPYVISAQGLEGQGLALLLAADSEELNTVLLSSVGAGLAGQLVARQSGGTNFNTVYQGALGADGDTLDAFHPVVAHVLQLALDPAEPSYGASLALTEPTLNPRDVLLIAGSQDTAVSEQSAALLAIAAGLQPTNPVGSVAAEAFEAAGLMAVDPPVEGNFSYEELGAGECNDRDPCRATGAFTTLDIGYNGLLDSEDGAWRWLFWNFTGAQGAPQLTPPQP